ncbi:MAG: biotin transporter BioY [Firmicutes bacterium]|nr:biotin transporter BioY [Bacillota bacterium]
MGRLNETSTTNHESKKSDRAQSAARLNGLILAGVFAAVTTVCSWITVPLPFTPVPVNLALLGVYLTGGLLGPYFGFYSQLIFVLLGAIGVPVFAGFSGGFGILTGPTGGYIIGYIFAAVLVGMLSEIGPSAVKKHTFIRLLLACFIGMTVCYAFGTAWYMISTGAGLWTALVNCVFPFLPGDAVKILLAAMLINRLKPILSSKL